MRERERSSSILVRSAKNCQALSCWGKEAVEKKRKREQGATSATAERRIVLPDFSERQWWDRDQHQRQINGALASGWLSVTFDCWWWWKGRKRKNMGTNKTEKLGNSKHTEQHQSSNWAAAADLAVTAQWLLKVISYNHLSLSLRVEPPPPPQLALFIHAQIHHHRCRRRKISDDGDDVIWPHRQTVPVYVDLHTC